jgi:two-component system, chemotaxis family, protein-glutamate methylesterase/glutaminase
LSGLIAVALKLWRSENRNLLHLNQAPQENSCRLSVDVLFRSVAQVFGAGALAVVMTGMGSDGARRAEQIRSAGREVIVQDEAASVVWGMPGYVYAAGQAYGMYPLKQLERQVTKRVMESRGAGVTAWNESAQPPQNTPK